MIFITKEFKIKDLTLLPSVALRGSQGEQFTELISAPLSGLLHSTFSALIILVLPAWRDGPVIRITVSPD